MKRYRFSLILLILLLLFAANGCSSKVPDEEPTITPTPTIVPKEPTYNLYISEVMADNDKLYLGTNYDWIEIGSLETSPVTLNGYFLTDDMEKPEALALDNKTIEAGGYLVISLDDDAPFHLDDKGETIYLTHNGEIVSELSYTEEIGTCSASADGVLSYATPGFPNTEEGYAAYTDSITLPDIMISEVIASNTKYAGVNGKFYDVIELHNNSTEAIRLNGLYLSDKEKNLGKYEIPDQILDAGGYLLIYCSELELENHASFKLSEGENVYLSDGEKVLDMIHIPKDLAKDMSYGRYEKLFVYMDEPTLGEENRPGNSERLKTPEVNVEPGLYSESISVELTGEGTIYYTLDGSRPTENSKIYEGPINLDTVTTIRAFAKEGERTSDLGAYTYLVGIDHTLPVVYVSAPHASVYEVTQNNHNKVERECILSLYEDEEMKFSVPCGLCLHGNSSRDLAKQNFSVRFRSKYGLSRLNYKLFDDLDIDSFNSLLIKGGSEDFRFANIRDEFYTGLCDGTTNLEVQNCKPCVLYLGDQYWGIYYIREQFTDEYVADHYNVSKESIDLLFSYNGVQNGSDKDYRELLNFAKYNDLTIEENYNKVIEQIDPISLMDWYICRSFSGDNDFANIRYFRSSEYDNKWRWMFFDLDWCFYNHPNNRPLSDLIVNNDCHILIYYLLKNDEFKDMFLKRYNELMDTILNEEHITSSLDEFLAVIGPEIPMDRARWNKTMDGWNAAIEEVYNFFKDGRRTKAVLTDIQSYFKLSDEQMKEYFGDKWE